MTSNSSQFAKDFLATALALGLAGGLVEGAGHMLLQRLNILENAWYEIIWIAALFNALLLFALAAVVVLVLSLLRNQSTGRRFAVFALAFAAFLPCLALMLKEWMRPYAILSLTIGLAAVFTRWTDRDMTRKLRLFRSGLPWVAVLTVAVFGGLESGFWLNEKMRTRNLPDADPLAADILLIVIDALRADHLSTYGYGRNTSPNIDSIAAQGVVFERALATASYTLPSHASMLTGLPPHEHGVEWESSKALRNAAYPIIGETLQGRGYRTAAFSGNTFWFSREHGFGRGFLHFEDYFHSIADMFFRTAYGRILTTTAMPRLGYEDIAARKRASDTNRAVLNWLGDDDRPFFVFINYMDVHDPYLPPQPYRSRFSQHPEPGGLINWQLHIPDDLTPEQLQSEIDAYDGAISYVDDQLGALLNVLRERRSSRELLVIITSDHGEEFREHGNLLHGHNLNRETIHVPLIFWQPGRVPEGVRVTTPVSHAAIPATIVETFPAGDKPFPGPPLQQLWNAAVNATESRYPLSELEHRPWVSNRYPVHYGSMRSVAAPEWHCIEHDTNGFELYDWVNDFVEANNLAETPGAADLMAECRTQLEAAMNRAARRESRQAGN